MGGIKYVKRDVGRGYIILNSYKRDLYNEIRYFDRADISVGMGRAASY